MDHLRSFVLLAALAGLVSCATPADRLVSDGFVRMKGHEIAEVLVGNSLDGEDSDGKYVIYYPSNTDMRIRYRGRKESGVWRVDGDKYCRKWKTFGKGKERCVYFFRNGDRIHWLQGNNITDRSVLVNGNPENL